MGSLKPKQALFALQGEPGRCSLHVSHCRYSPRQLDNDLPAYEEIDLESLNQKRKSSAIELTSTVLTQCRKIYIERGAVLKYTNSLNNICDS